MGSDPLLVSLIGLTGIVTGVVAMIVIISRRRAARKAYRSKQSKEEAETISVLGEAVDVRELRILRALVGEPKGRCLGSFKEKYYRPSLEATIAKRWVTKSGSRYFLTPKGGEFCRTYLNHLLDNWKQPVQVRAFTGQ